MNQKRRDEPAVAVLGDRTTDHFVINIPAPGGMQGNCDFENHAGWRSLAVEGGVHMAAAMMQALGLETRIFWPKSDKTLYSSAELMPDPNRDPATVAGPNGPYRIARFNGYWNAEGRQDPSTDDATGLAASVIVFNDAGYELRDASDLWTGILEDAAASDRTIIHKMHLPLGKGALWDRIAALKPNGRRRILHISATDLRLAGLRLSRCLSWDRVIEECAVALAGQSVLATLAGGTDWIIVQFGVEGAVLISCSSERKLWLVCDPALAEDDVDRRVKGEAVGRMNVFLAGLVQGIGTAEPDEDRLTAALEPALARARAYSAAAFNFPAGAASAPGAGPVPAQQVYPAMIPAANSGEDRDDGTYVKFRPRTLQEAACETPVSLLDHGADGQTARDIVENGYARLNSLPSARFEELRTVDRGEIEGYRAIDHLLRRHLDLPRRDKPISIAVFGPPGSGKSYGVKQLVDDSVPVLTFNLSEATSDDLPGFFQEIRDRTLAGKTPLCFFDEFDAHERSLVARFLAPMQDGEFRHGPRVHPIGGAIFVFAGGTAESFSDFEGKIKDGDPEKIRDFISRLDGFIDIRGPNPNDRDQAEGRHVLRRAVLLRSQIERHAGTIISGKKAEIDPALIDAFLNTTLYRHGARSMEKLVRMCLHAPGQKSIMTADLPPFEQLNMHVCAQDFLGILQGRK